MITETVDAAIVNAVANSPDVRPYIGGVGYLDVTPVLENPLNVALWGDHGGWLYAWSAPGVYEVHTLVLPSGRGAWARKAAKQSLAMMADRDATMIWTRIRRDLRHVRAFAVMCGLRSAGVASFDLGDGAHDYELMTWRPTPCH